MRGMVQLLRSQDIPLDYPALAEDLFWFQIPSQRAKVCLRWGQDFYRRDLSENHEENKEEESHE